IHPKLMDKKEIETCLSHLAVVNKNVSASTQRQAVNAIFFLFREVLGNTIEDTIRPVKT
ncbi:MAG: phage integrase N-terminal SAM-like domain-containing protein, partial [Calditrichia bacterium]|nr:phage integrase N-terminal SAM-like domain-containing protein [Calditrichia bacterium]